MGRLFQARGPATAKARSPVVVGRVAGTMRSADDVERRRRRDSALATGQMTYGSSVRTRVRTGILVGVLFQACCLTNPGVRMSGLAHQPHTVEVTRERPAPLC